MNELINIAQERIVIRVIAVRKLEEHSIEVHNSRRPLDRLTLTFDLIFIGGRGIVMDYPSMPLSLIHI